MVESMKEIHGEIKKRIEESNAKYKQHADKKRRVQNFQEGGMVMVYLLKERFPSGTYSKLSKKKIGPSRIIKKIGGNAYEVDLPPHAGIHPTFNIQIYIPIMLKKTRRKQITLKLEDEFFTTRGT